MAGQVEVDVRPQPHILVVEDDRNLREILVDALELEGFSVVSVEHGEAALRHLAGGARPCVILLDLMMPVMDGWTFRQALLDEETLAHIPVVIMTAAGTNRIGSIQAVATLHKPLDVDSVLAVVQGYCTARAAPS
jgi:CheY-like chemotaxis protein